LLLHFLWLLRAFRGVSALADQNTIKKDEILENGGGLFTGGCAKAVSLLPGAILV